MAKDKAGAALFRADRRNLARGLSPHVSTDLGAHPSEHQFQGVIPGIARSLRKCVHCGACA
jgi:hypothetical protein